MIKWSELNVATKHETCIMSSASEGFCPRTQHIYLHINMLDIYPDSAPQMAHQLKSHFSSGVARYNGAPGANNCRAPCLRNIVQNIIQFSISVTVFKICSTIDVPFKKSRTGSPTFTGRSTPMCRIISALCVEKCLSRRTDQSVQKQRIRLDNHELDELTLIDDVDSEVLTGCGRH